MSFMSGLGTLLGGFNVARRIDDEGFDFREAEEARQFERDRIRELARQQDEDRLTGQIEDVLAGQGEVPDLEAARAVIPEGVDEASRERAVQVALGRLPERKSNLALLRGQVDLNKIFARGDVQAENIGLRGDERRDYAILQEALLRGRPLTDAEQARWDAYNRRTRMYEDRPVGGLLGGGAVGLTPEGLDAAAQTYARTGKMPTLGMGAAGTRQAIINRAAEMFPGVDIATNAAQYGASAGALRNITKQRTAVTAFEDTAHRNAEMLKDSLKKIPDFGMMPLNHAARAIQTVFGDEDMATFTTNLQSVRNEYARIISNPNLVGQMSDSARREGEVLLNPNATVNQLLAALSVLQAEAQNRRESFVTQEEELRQSIGGDTAVPAGVTGGSGTADDPFIF